MQICCFNFPPLENNLQPYSHLQKTYPLKLKIIAEKKIIEVGGSVNLQKLNILKYYIPHFGDVTINEDGSILIENSEEKLKTKIRKCDAVLDDYREVINERITRADKLKQLVKDNPLAVSKVGVNSTLLL